VGGEGVKCEDTVLSAFTEQTKKWLHKIGVLGASPDGMGTLYLTFLIIPLS